ncbi:glutamate receptor 4-like [Corticium candelabrum]|uniref:glutamate receptor 4-like n=1 Tax=Corticium candelabrum TaxID=121492 RepID=UPI002E26D61C|nr:glutamate receptor 4-like [Corticium candelabrum]
MTAAAMSVTEQRSKHVYFTHPYFEAGKTLLVSNVKSSRLLAFLDPFDPYTIAVLVLSLFTTAVTWIVIKRISLSKDEIELLGHEGGDNSLPSRWGNALWYFYATAMQLTPDVGPSAISGRLIMAAWYFFTLVIVATYTANLAAYLTIKSAAKNHVTSVDDLVGQTKIKYGTVADSSVVDFFKYSQVEKYNRIYRGLSNVDNLTHGLDEVKDESDPYVFIWDTEILEFASSTDGCNTKVVGRPFNNQHYALAFPKDTPYGTNISLAILRLRERGMIEEWIDKWISKSSKCGSGSESDEERTVSINDMQGVFTILCITFGAAIVVAFVERRVHGTPLEQTTDS